MRGVSSLTKAALSEGLGKLELFRHTNPSGRYRLDLGREVCRAVAIKLHDLNKQEGRVCPEPQPPTPTPPLVKLAHTRYAPTTACE